MKKLIAILLITFSFTSYAADNEKYELVLHQSADAKTLDGSVDSLMKAVRAGKQIRLYMNLGSVEHSMDAGFISIFEGHVYAQINEIQAQRPNRKTKEIELRPYAKHLGLYSTKSPYEIKWFAF